jgi:hypothetical protein
LVVLFGPLFLSKSKLVVFVTPYTYSKTISVTLDSQQAEFSPGIVPVVKKEFSVRAVDAVAATGTKTTGDKAKGEIVIFNKQDKTIAVPKGSILTDPKGQKFELSTSVSVAASTSDLNTGTITMGQTRAMIQAADIGADYNIAKDVQLSFKDFASTSLVTKTTQALTGGFSKQINAVSDADKKNLETKLNQDISQLIDEKLKKEVDTLQGALKDTIKTQKSRPEFGREIGEESDELTGEIKADVSVFVISPDIKKPLIESYLASEEGFDQSTFNINNFDLNFKITQTQATKATGQLIITGKSTPNLDINSLTTSLKFKPTSKVGEIIKSFHKRVYDYQITRDNTGLLKLMPASQKNIIVEVKTE